MEQRDYLLRQIEMMSQTLVALIRRLLGLKEITEEEFQEATDVVLSEQLNISMDDLLKFPETEITELLVNRHGIQPENLELFAEILLLNANSRKSSGERKDLLQKALELITWVDQNGTTFSIERHQKIQDIGAVLADLNE